MERLDDRDVGPCPRHGLGNVGQGRPGGEQRIGIDPFARPDEAHMDDAHDSPLPQPLQQAVDRFSRIVTKC